MIIKLNNEEKVALRKLCNLFFKNEADDWKSKINYLFLKFFNPKIRKKQLYENVHSLIQSNEYDFSVMGELESKGLVERIGDGNIVIPKPLGVLVFTFGENISENVINSLINQYHNITEFKLLSAISQFGKLPLLPFSQIAPLIFLLYNNNISQYQGKFEKNTKLNKIIDKINSAFVESNHNTLGTKDNNASLSGYYLTQANNKLGIPIYNKEPFYYIKSSRVKDVERAIIKSIQKDLIKAKSSFEAFEKAFEKHSKLLLQYGGLYSTRSSKERVRRLFNGGNPYGSNKD